MGVTIYHNPECGTSRNVLKIIKASGEEPEIVLYLQRGWTRELLAGLLSAADLTPRQALRTSKSPAEELGLTDPSVDDSILFEAMLKHPILVNRPIVVTKKGTALCRPSEKVFDLLENPPTSFTKEDGEIISPA
ncbi:MAG TPA: arsenate reductase (glutaredoxin) [Hyphomonas atlantica]|uniref:Arsenate reductase n=1 Tax=Hyphomonas atlantica TaxID=1280948 RepID=A0A356W388_9PROT|nr:arsenate reductase (glutaredoxin) [Hyphomonas atlantica]|tara:strand:+ start:169 stop:570 length:402 start_codon:yes stop_codon:yes gene_type:complete